VQAGDVFVALRGARADGETFLPQAVERGAVGLLTEGAACCAPGVTLTVPSVTAALLRAASLHRQQSRAFVVAVSGSTGKTTVKEGIAAVLGEMGSVEKSEENFNSGIGLPLSVLSFEDADFWVCELGISHPGEMRPMAEALRPDLAVLTNVGHAHVGNFEDQNALMVEKAQIAACLGRGGRVLTVEALPKKLFLCDPASVFQIGAELRVEKISCTPMGVRCDLIGADRGITDLEWPIPGSVGVATVATVAAAGMMVGATDSAIRLGLKRAGARTPRMHRYTVGARMILEDCYNASPEAVIGALEVLKHLAPQRPLVAVLGDMLELGGYAARLHYAVGEAVARLGFSMLFAYGEHAAHTARGAAAVGMPAVRCFSFTSAERAGLIRAVCQNTPADAAVLFKASGRVGMKGICEEIGRKI
jgi:UDP-N-acetylmuramoyl-tripeptide--D-alanyl-D-alanine ligase